MLVMRIYLIILFEEMIHYLKNGIIAESSVFAQPIGQAVPRTGYDISDDEKKRRDNTQASYYPKTALQRCETLIDIQSSENQKKIFKVV